MLTKAGPAVRGGALILAGMAVIGFTDNFVRVIAAEVSVWQFHAMRSALMLPILAAVAAVAGLRLRPHRWGPVTVRCALQAAALVLYFGALPFMPIAQVGAGFFTAPLFVLLFSAALFGHRIGARQILAVAIGFAGVVIMLRPDPANLSVLTAMPLAAGALYGLSNLLTREWCAGEPVGALLAGFFGALGVAGLLGCAVFTLWPVSDPVRTAVPFLTQPLAAPSSTAMFWIAVQAVGSLAAVGCITRAYQIADTGSVTVFEYSFLLTATFWSWLLWGEGLDALGFLGVALIIASGAIIGFAPAPGPAPGYAASAGWKRP
jgi:drug/metabolite transporter (DMT)-like permease